MRGKRLWSYLALGVAGGVTAAVVWSELTRVAMSEPVVWRNPLAFGLLAGCALVVWVHFHLRHLRTPTLRFSRVSDLRPARRGWVSRLAGLPSVFRIVALGLIVAALARPQTFREEIIEVEGIDIMLVLDLSRSMEERDLRRNRLDAGQRTIRQFLERRQNDRIGLVVFATEAMLQCPLTADYKTLDAIVSDLAIGDVPEMGTAIGDALGLALGSLRRSEAASKVVILVSDGDSNVAKVLDPVEAKDIAVEMGVRVFTVLVGAEPDDAGGAFFRRRRHAVNPALLRDIAQDTGGLFFRAGDHTELDNSFEAIRSMLEKSNLQIVGTTPDKDLFSWLLFAALSFLGFELLLRLTRWRRFP
jgi:Ca-activated chloride channel family protein